MTVSMQITKRIYAGNGVTRQWDVDFPVASAEHIRVYVTSPVGSEEEIQSDFKLNADGTELTYPTVESGKSPLAAGWSITLVRQTPLTQEIDLIRQGELDAEVLEGGYDKLTLLVQELNEKVSRSIKYPVSAQPSDLETDNFLKNILSVKQDAVNASTAAVSAAQNAQQSAFSAQQTAQTALEEIASAADTAQSVITQSGQTVENTLETYLSAAHEEAETARYYAEHSIGKTIGEVFFSQSNLATDNVGALPLFTGETIASANTLYPEFYAWVLAHPELQVTADGYESALAEYGECPKYVIGGGSLRLPLLKNYIKAANTTEGVKNISAGLPNITGKVGQYDTGNTIGSSLSGAFYAESDTGTSGAYSGWNTGTNNKEFFDASRSNDIYGNSDTVTPPSTTLYPWVCAYTAAVAASTAVAAQFQAALSGKVDLPSGKTQADIDYVTESYHDEDGNWYRVYKSGWVEQGGSFASASTVTVSFLKPFLDTAYTFISSSGANITSASKKSGTTIIFDPTYNASTKVGGNWVAYGQGE